MNIWIKIYIAFIVAIYYAGVLSGWYFDHPQPKVWYNPDAYIHSAIFNLGPIAIVAWWQGRKRERAKSNVEEKRSTSV